MKDTKLRLAPQLKIWTLATGIVLGLALPGLAQLQHLSITVPGGMPAQPIITGITQGSNSVTVTWDGPAGYYQLYQRPSETATWQKLGGLRLSRRAVVSGIYSDSLFRVSGPQGKFAGTQSCSQCHGKIYNSETKTRHHAVGVKCENCHGPAANHVANENDSVFKPRVELASEVCGGCHSGAPEPLFEEWSQSAHSGVVLDMNPPDRISSCGRCHSGSVRNALLHGRNPATAVKNDANMAIECSTCHDPHAKRVFTNVLSGAVYTTQLRNPVSSTADYSMSTSAVFTNRYNPRINICAQCHNHRGASWKSTDRPPHGSLQYNMLLGTVGELQSGAKPRDPAAHALEIEKQCVGCHMETTRENEEQVRTTGHTFRVTSFEGCTRCHPFPEGLVNFTQSAVMTQLQDVKALLDLWATTRAPEALQQYGTRAWEYTSPGRLSNVGGATGRGPTAEEQALIPDAIKKARFNVYLVLQDGSFGVHNAPYTATLLNEAEMWIMAAFEE